MKKRSEVEVETEVFLRKRSAQSALLKTARVELSYVDIAIDALFFV